MLGFLVSILVLAAQPAPSPEPTRSPIPPAPSDVNLQMVVPTPVPTKPPCSTAKIAPSQVIDSRDATPGNAFGFTVSSVNDPLGHFPSVAAGENGFGVVSVVRHARAGGDPGLLVLEARYIVDSTGAHIPVEFVRTINGLFLGSTRNSPGVLDLIPYVGYVTSAYDALHKGSNVAAGPADSLLVAIGDDAVVGACALPPPPQP